MKNLKNVNKSTRIYFVLIACIALSSALSTDILSNFFKDAYQVSPYQRGLIEFPRELPGMLCLLLIASLSFLSDIRISIVAQILGFLGMIVLGLTTPTYLVMLLFIFINSLGGHMFMPLQESIGITIIRDPDVSIGKRVGQYKGVITAFAMTGSLIVFLGFRLHLFSFTTNIKWPFLLSALVTLIAIILLLLLDREDSNHRKTEKKFRWIFRKEYKLYYVLVIMFGVQKQMILVYGPWILIDLLGKKADTIALLSIIGAFIGIFFMPAIGRALDRFGVKTMLYADALSYIVVYLLYGIVTALLVTGHIPSWGIPVFIMYTLFIFDKMSVQMGMVRTLYLNSILIDPDDLTPTLSLGISMDHFVSIFCAYMGGIIWSVFGPQYVFFLAAALSCINLAVAIAVKKEPAKS